MAQKFKEQVPDALIELWEECGLGKYGEGLIELIDPDQYRATLRTWLGKETPNYTPIALSAFGDLFYFRKLTETDEDVCILEGHYRAINTCTWSLESFFNSYLTDPGIQDEILRRPLFEAALGKLGPLHAGEAYYFVPALALGGAESEEFLEKGNAAVHLDLLFQLG